MTFDLVNFSAVIALIMEVVDTEELSGQSKGAFHHSGWLMWLLFSLLIGLNTAPTSAKSSWVNTLAEGELSAPDNTDFKLRQPKICHYYIALLPLSVFCLSLGVANYKGSSPRLLNNLWVEIVLCILYHPTTAIRQSKMFPVGGSTHTHTQWCMHTNTTGRPSRLQWADDLGSADQMRNHWLGKCGIMGLASDWLNRLNRG